MSAHIDKQNVLVNRFVVGGGFKYKDKYSIEIRYDRSQPPDGSGLTHFKNNTVSFILGYKLF